ncbi:MULTISPECIES: hypothetical protein [unclassified Acidovorax]|uniref:hypothetical protein n=1 Tax=unclassified Acidovorax TaxID=2684926 RepID=UPI001C47E56C|nr:MULTISPECIES: hypothetical protein [unclassified Acidovorax]MBV7428076.1 hypothetical protein [Acidovorax sp. sif0732]MBV7449333.1 hypothetical protein [Acidovorax sp. sif0715]
MIPNPLFLLPFAGGKDLWADVDFDSMPPRTRRMVERARDGDRVRLADEIAKSAALSAQLIRATAIASEFQLQLDEKAHQ